MSAEKKEVLNLHQKILKIADMAGVLQRTKEGYGYKYVPEEDIQAKVTAGLQMYGVMLYDSIVPGTLNVVPIHYEKYDTKIKGLKPVNEVIVYGDMTYTWVNVENPEEVVKTTWAFVGQMEDAAQAMGAGLTYGNRYYLMKQLQLATTESDPDNYRSKQHKAEDDLAERERKTEARELAKHIKEVIEKGNELLKLGMEKETMMEIVGKYNGGNGNPASIKAIETCKAVIEEFEKANKQLKGEKK